MSKLTYKGERIATPDTSGIERNIYAIGEAIHKADQQQRMQMSQKIVDGANKLSTQEFENSAQKSLIDIYQRNAANPEAFQKESDAALKGLSKGLPFHLKDDLIHSYKKQQNHIFASASANQIKVNDDKILEQNLVSQQLAEQNAMQAITDITNNDLGVQGLSNLGEATQQMNEKMYATNSSGMPIFSAPQRIKAMSNFRSNIFNKFVLNTTDSMGSLNEKVNFINDVVTGKAKLNFGQEDGMSFNQLTQQQQQSLSHHLQQVAKASMQQEAQNASLQHVQNVIDNKDIADPKDKTYLKAVDVYYNSNMALKNVDIENPIQRVAAANSVAKLVSDTKAVPPSLESDLRAYLNSDDPNYFALASEIVGSISVNAPDQMSAFNNKDIAKAKDMNLAITSGIKPEKAFAKIEKSYSLMSPEVLKDRSKKFDKFANDNPELFSPEKMKHGLWFFKKMQEPAAPYISDEFARQYKEITKTLMVGGSTEEGALNSAKDIMHIRWGNSSINGIDQLTALPPEKYYEVKQVGLNSKWMRDRAVEHANKYSTEKLTKDDVLIIPDMITYQTAGDSTTKPTYVLSTKKNDLLDLVLDENFNPVRVGENIWRDEQAVKLFDEKSGLTNFKEKMRYLESLSEEENVERLKKKSDVFKKQAAMQKKVELHPFGFN